MMLLLARNLRHALSKKLWLFLAIALATALITGALILGSSVRQSQRDAAESRLGRVDSAIIPQNQWFGASLAQRVAADSEALIHVKAFAFTADSTPIELNLYGVDESFFPFVYGRVLPQQAMANRAARQALGIGSGAGEVQLRIPLGSSFSEQISWSLDEPAIEGMRVQLGALPEEAEDMLEFNPLSDQAGQAQIFLPKKLLEEKLKRVGQSNILLLKNPPPSPSKPSKSSKPLYTAPIALEDYGLSWKKLKSGEYELGSQQSFIPEALGSLARDLPTCKRAMLSYFVNSINAHGKSTPYSFITGEGTDLRQNECRITQWLADDLNLRVGDRLRISYYDIQSQGEWQTREQVLSVVGIVPTEDRRELVPAFPGFAESESCTDWDSSLPIDTATIREKDEAYWRQYQSSPKIFVSLPTAQRLFGSPHGQWSALRFDSDARGALEAQLAKHTSLFAPIPLKEQSQQGVAQGMDFSGLFLGLSFFVIIAALILLYLITVLHMDTRKQELAILRSMGYSSRQLFLLLGSEFTLYTLLGGLLGLVLAADYVWLILTLLNSAWQSITGSLHIELHLALGDFALGFGISTLICLLSMARALHKSLRASLQQELEQDYSRVSWTRRDRLWLGILLGLFAAGTVAAYLSAPAEQMMYFFTSSFILLFLSFKLVKYLIQRGSRSELRGLVTLAAKNNARFLPRAMSILSILGLGVFLCGLTILNYRTLGDDPTKSSGTGGYYGIFTTVAPIKYDLNTPAGREQYQLENLPEKLRFCQLRLVEGSSAGCLNLNRVLRPQLLGVPARSLEGRFSFTQDEASWDLLEQDLGDNIIPVIADAEVIQWSLGLSLGDELPYLASDGKEYRLRFVAALTKSLFQGYVLVSEANIQRMYPHLGGSRLLLVDFDSQPYAKQISERLDRQGVFFTRAADRLNLFNAVQNTYLMIFFCLGSIALALGCVGFVLLIKQHLSLRRHEFFLLRSAGYSTGQLTRLIILENTQLLLLGMGTSLLALLSAAAPLIAQGMVQPPYLMVLGCFAGITLLGLIGIIAIAYLGARDRQ